MANPLDTDAGSELFSSYEAELKLVQADLNQKLDQIAETTGEQRKSAIGMAERALDEATELVCTVQPRVVLCFLDHGLTNRSIVGPNAHGETKHPLRRALQSQRPLPQLLQRHRRTQTQTQIAL